MKHDESINPWGKVAEEKVYENQWIQVEHHQVINPSGNEGIYGKVHFKNKALGIIPLDKEMNTWLVGQYRYTLDEYSWEIPMGGGPIDQNILASAKRELKEETGLTAANWNKVLRLHTSNSVTDEEGFVYVATDLTQGEVNFDDTEDLQIKKIQFSEAVELAMQNKITDSLSVAGLLKVKAMIEAGEITV